MATRKKAFGWDGGYYSRLWQVPVSQLQAQGTVPSSEQVTKAKTIKMLQSKIKRLSGVFSGSDADASARTRSAYLKAEYIQADNAFFRDIDLGFGINSSTIRGGLSIDDAGTVYFFRQL